MSRITRLALLLLLALPAGCAISRGPRAAAPMPLAPPLYKRDLPGYSVHGISWLGNDRLVFDGRPAGGDSPGGLYLWDLQGAPRRLLERSLGACVTADLIRAHTTGADGKAHRVALRPPDFKPVPLPEPPKIKGPTYFDRYTCTVRPVPEYLHKRLWRPLEGAEAFLDFGPVHQEIGRLSPILYFDSRLGRSWNTGLALRGRPWLRISLPSSDKAYLIHRLSVSGSLVKQWRRLGAIEYWTLDSSGLGTEHSLPLGPWFDDDFQIFQVKSGLVIVGNDFDKNHLPRGAGAYLVFENGGHQRLERGLVQGLAASPDGCKLAYSYNYRLDRRLPSLASRLVWIDVCGLSIRA